MLKRLLLILAAACPLAAQPSVPLWSLSAKPTLEIGDETDPHRQFARIGAVGRFSDGSIVVADGESQELRVFSMRGEFVRSLSRKGSGPGELRFLHSFFLAGDTIIVPEGQPGEANVNTYLPSGFRARVSLKSPGRGGIYFAGRFPDGRFAVTPGFRVVPELPVGTMLTDTVRIGTMPLEESATPVWIGSFPSKQIWLVDSPFVPGRPFPVDFSFGRQVAYAVSGDRLWIGDSESGLVLQYASSGQKIGEFKAPIHGREFRVDVLDRVKESRLASVAADNKMQRTLVEGLYKAPRPKLTPAFTQFRPGARGEMWLRLFDEDPEAPSTFVVLDQSGKAIARVILPKGFTVHDIGSDYVLGVHRDEDGVERVRAYDLRRR